jgi:hypothetical protein
MKIFGLKELFDCDHLAGAIESKLTWGRSEWNLIG